MTAPIRPPFRSTSAHARLLWLTLLASSPLWMASAACGSDNGEPVSDAEIEDFCERFCQRSEVCSQTDFDICEQSCVINSKNDRETCDPASHAAGLDEASDCLELACTEANTCLAAVRCQ